MKVKARPILVFDLGGVLVKVERQRTIDRLATLSGVSADAVRAVLAAPLSVGGVVSLGELYGTGQITTAEYCQAVVEKLGGKLSGRNVREAELLTLCGEMTETRELLVELVKIAPVVCLSNTHEIHWDELLQNYPTIKLFAHKFASQELHLHKPDPRIYQAVEKALSVKPSSCLLIDDTLPNIESARTHGWEGIHFTSAVALRAELIRRGVL